MKLFLLGISGIFVSLLHAQDRSISFEQSSLAEIKAKAANENKAIFLDAFTSWCGPCKKLAREVFTDDEVADYFNAHFINASFDMEKGEGVRLVKLYGIKAYPSLVFIDADGKMISKREGALDKRSFLDFAKTSASGEALEVLVAKYKKGNRDFTFMKKFMTRMQ